MDFIFGVSVTNEKVVIIKLSTSLFNDNLQGHKNLKGQYIE